MARCEGPMSFEQRWKMRLHLSSNIDCREEREREIGYRRYPDDKRRRKWKIYNKKINNKASGTTRDQMFVFFSEMYKTTRYDGSTSTDVCEDSSSTKTWSDGRRRGCAVSADPSLQSSPFTSLLSLRLGDGREVKAASAPKYPPPPPSRRKQGGTYL